MNYGELRQQIIDFSKRTDMVAAIPSFVELAHNRIQSELEAPDHIGWVELDTSGAVNITGSVWSVPLPDDCYKVRFVYASGRSVSSFHEQGLIDRLGQTGSVSTGGYAVQGVNILFAPGIGDPVQLSYQRRLPMFSQDSDTNWTLTNYSSLYLYAALAHLYEFTQNYEQEAQAISLYDAAWAVASPQVDTLKQGGVPSIRRA